MLSLFDLCLGVEKKFLIGEESAVATKCLFSNFIDKCKEWQRKFIINIRDFDKKKLTEDPATVWDTNKDNEFD